MLVRDAIRGYYAILDRDDEALARVLLSRSRVLQIRLKPAAASDILRVATWARALCTAQGAALIVNDRVDIALAVGADGVHLGQTDLPLAEARTLVGRMWIGVSTHNLPQVHAALAGGADYLGYGPVFPTRTKANPDPVQGLDALAAAVQAAGTTPIVAIGGITPATGASVYGTGAAALCAISAVNDAPDPARVIDEGFRPVARLNSL